MEFFETSGRNLLAAEAAAGVGHHVALSVVGTDRLLESGYFRAKMAQENLIKASNDSLHDRPRQRSSSNSWAASPNRATDGQTVRLPPALLQPIASDDVAAAMADVAVGAPVNGTIEMAGPERIPLDELVRRFLTRNPRSTQGGHRCPRTLLRHRVERSIAHPRRQPAHRPDAFRGLAQLHASEVSQPGRVDAQIKQSARPAMSCLALWTGAECKKRTMREPWGRGGAIQRQSIKCAGLSGLSRSSNQTHETDQGNQINQTLATRRDMVCDTVFFFSSPPVLKIRDQESACPAPWPHARDQSIRAGTRSCRLPHAETAHNLGDRYALSA